VIAGTGVPGDLCETTYPDGGAVHCTSVDYGFCDYTGLRRLQQTVSGSTYEPYVDINKNGGKKLGLAKDDPGSNKESQDRRALISKREKQQRRLALAGHSNSDMTCTGTCYEDPVDCCDDVIANAELGSTTHLGNTWGYKQGLVTGEHVRMDINKGGVCYEDFCFDDWEDTNYGFGTQFLAKYLSIQHGNDYTGNPSHALCTQEAQNFGHPAPAKTYDDCYDECFVQLQDFTDPVKGLTGQYCYGFNYNIHQEACYHMIWRPDHPLSPCQEYVDTPFAFFTGFSNSLYYTPRPTTAPTGSPTAAPTDTPPAQCCQCAHTFAPSTSPSSSPTQSPIQSNTPTSSPTTNPTVNPTSSPTTNPSNSPTTSPTTNPSNSPTTSPTTSPTSAPTVTQVCTNTGGNFEIQLDGVCNGRENAAEVDMSNCP